MIEFCMCKIYVYFAIREETFCNIIIKVLSMQLQYYIKQTVIANLKLPLYL